MLNPLAAVRGFLERRAYAVADMYVEKLGQPQWSTWSIAKAVKNGYMASSWVYKSVFLLQQAASSVTMGVFNKDGERIDEHHISRLMKYPNPHISSKMLNKLITAWMHLAGNSYLNKIRVGGQTHELWPISPDRCAPVPAPSPVEWIKGYAIDQKPQVAFEPDEIIHMKFLDPSNPLVGVAPLVAASRAVDVDVDQQAWNKAAMQNRGVVDGVFSFERSFKDQDEADVVAKKLNKRHGGAANARRIGVLGGKAKYYRTGLTAIEMDFVTSRKFNREEILIIFGIPPQYAGAMEQSTYNNYQTSELVFWFGTVIPFLMDIGDQMTFSFHDELEEGLRVLPDISNVPAVRRALREQSDTAKTFYEMGVPFSQINKAYNFGFEEFEGWDESNPNKSSSSSSLDDGAAAGEDGEGAESRSRHPLIHADAIILKNDPQESRSAEIRVINSKKKVYDLVERREDLQMQYEKQIDDLNEEVVGPQIEAILSMQADLVDEDVQKNNGRNAAEIISRSTEELKAALTEIYIKYGVMFGREAVVQRAEIGEDLEQSIKGFIAEEQIILTEVSNINATSVKMILDQVDDAFYNGKSITELQQAISDAGIFSPARALRIGRTVLGTAGSVGQLQAAMLGGATHKTWLTSMFEVRKEHQEREGETKRINETFSAKFGMVVGPRFPLDNRLVPADRVNCRCSMSFSIQN